MGLGVGRRMGHGRHALVQCSAVSAQGFERAMNKAVSLIVTALTPPDLEQPSLKPRIAEHGAAASLRQARRGDGRRAVLRARPSPHMQPRTPGSVDRAGAAEDKP
jgi:hypothetical protein